MTYREWATPLTIGSFLLIAVTGVLMFFHLDSGLNKLAHEGRRSESLHQKIEGGDDLFAAMRE